MPLFPYAVGLREPGSDFVVNLLHAFEAKCVKMISWRKSLDAPEAWTLEPSGEDNVAVHPLLPNDKCGEAHADLKGDPRLFGQDGDWAVPFGEQQKSVEDGADGCRLAGKVGGQRVTAACVGLIPIRKLPPAFGAPPHGPARAGNLPRP
jgi:hypothetical protein